MEVNDIQIGGNHYKIEYQHWDFVCDTNLHYLLGCATKYIARYEEKNGVEDLRKAIHYISKAEFEDIWPENININITHVMRFVEQLQGPSSIIIQSICLGHYDEANTIITELINKIDSGPTSAYVNQDRG